MRGCLHRNLRRGWEVGLRGWKKDAPGEVVGNAVGRMGWAQFLDAMKPPLRHLCHFSRFRGTLALERESGGLLQGGWDTGQGTRNRSGCSVERIPLW